MIRSLPRQAFAALLVLATLAASCPAQTASVPVPRRLPPQVVAYISVPDASDLKKRFEASQFGLMIQDPAMAGFVADVKAAFTSASLAGISVPSISVSLASPAAM